MEQVIEVKDFKNDTPLNDNTWSSCCSNRKTDSRLLKFISVHSIVLIIIIFCLFELDKVDTCEDSNMYSSLLTFSLGLIIKVS